ncbi:MAG: penicillin-binding protein 2, partial [candidate division Zixibacteria bacterium]
MDLGREKLTVSQRSHYAIGVVLVITLFCLAGLIRLQVFKHKELYAMSEKNRIRFLPIMPKRGIIYDREGKVIVDNRPSYTVSVIPVEEVKYRTLPQLSSLIGFDTTRIRNRIKSNFVTRYQPAAIKRDVPFETIAILEEQYSRFPGVSYQMERVRDYSERLGVESFTGYVGEISEAELKVNTFKDIGPGSVVGKKGLERQYDLLLRGYEGTAYVEVSASGQIIGEYEERPPIKPIPGADLSLTIDIDLQRACVEAMDTFCCGGVVAMDPRNGEVLAMVSFPSYDPNMFSSVIPESLWQEITTDSTHPLLNRPLRGLYPPGSQAKLVTLGAGLEEGLITASTTFKPCAGGFQFGNRFFRCWKAGGHGYTNAVQSLEHSCDVYYYQLGVELGIDKLSHYYNLSGFGIPAGIDLPGEEEGNNPNTDYYDGHYGKGKWTRGLVLNIAIGQGELLVNLFQTVQFYCGVVNGGLVFRPHLLKIIHHPDKGPETVAPELSFKLPFSESTLNILKEGILMVVEGKEGTARNLKNPFYSIGGKTGTVENPHGENHSWFVGVAPFEAPEIVVAAIVENSG